MTCRHGAASTTDTGMPSGVTGVRGFSDPSAFLALYASLLAASEIFGWATSALNLYCHTLYHLYVGVASLLQLVSSTTLSGRRTTRRNAAIAATLELLWILAIFIFNSAQRESTLLNSQGTPSRAVNILLFVDVASRTFLHSTTSYRSGQNDLRHALAVSLVILVHVVCVPAVHLWFTASDHYEVSSASHWAFVSAHLLGGMHVVALISDECMHNYRPTMVIGGKREVLFLDLLSLAMTTAALWTWFFVIGLRDVVFHLMGAMQVCLCVRTLVYAQRLNVCSLMVRC